MYMAFNLSMNKYKKKVEMGGYIVRISLLIDYYGTNPMTRTVSTLT